MRFRYNSETALTDISIGTKDICLFCSLQSYCPLMGALETNLVYPSADKLTIKECPVYTPLDIGA